LLRRSLCFYKLQKVETMTLRIVDEDITLIPYYPNPDEALPWYQDAELCRQVDNTDRVYDLELLESMYNYLSANGSCFYISFRGALVGDVTLLDKGEIAIVVSREYQNRHIGRRCVLEMTALAREKGFDKVTANIYSFNTQSQKMFMACGFERISEEWFEYRIKTEAEK